MQAESKALQINQSISHTDPAVVIMEPLPNEAIVNSLPLLGQADGQLIMVSNLNGFSCRPSGFLTEPLQMGLHFLHPQRLLSCQSHCQRMLQAYQLSTTACCSSVPRPACGPALVAVAPSARMPLPSTLKDARASGSLQTIDCTCIEAF